MRVLQLLFAATHNLLVRPLRTALNLIGVIISGVLLLSTLAAATGISNAITRFVEESHEARQIRIVADYDRSKQAPEDALAVDGQMSERRLRRMQQMLEQQWKRDNLTRPRTISFDKLDTIADLPHVIDVLPRFQYDCSFEADLTPNEDPATDSSDGSPVPSELLESAHSSISATSYADLELASRIVFGGPLSADAPSGILIHEAMCFELGIRDDSELCALIGQRINLTFKNQKDSAPNLARQLVSLHPDEQQRLLDGVQSMLGGTPVSELDAQTVNLLSQLASQQLKSQLGQASSTTAPATHSFEITGIFRSRDEEDATSFLTRYYGEGKLICHYSLLRSEAERRQADGASSATVYLDDLQHLTTTIDALKLESVQPVTISRTIERLNEAIGRSASSVLIVVLIVLFVSAVGISNTMIISLVERSEEIGIMKAVGASTRQVWGMVMFEGILTGLLGGAIAIGVSYGIAHFGNDLLIAFVEQRVKLQLSGDLFRIEPWMVLATLATTTACATLAGIWPARRAAKMDPIVAMRKA